ncbi:MAG TPA: hypothetical protein VL240_12350 [Candidatus Binatia bacterium]|nr:hypothetical protein [Candidatus Binatia bacterium]
MHIRLIDYVFWFAAPILQMGVLVCMFRRGLHRDYPYFFNYTILQVVSVPVLAIFRIWSYNAYFYSYWVNLGLSVLISFAVLQEIFKDAFRPYEALRDLSVILFRWSALVVFLVGVMWAINAARKPEADPVMDAILLAERSVRLMQCGLVFFLLLFSEYLGIARRSLLFGISLGFGFFAAINMLVDTGAAHRGIVHRSTLSTINSGAYVVAAALWFGYALIQAPSAAKIVQAKLRSGEWNSALEGARVPVPADSLLDSMDRTVERLLYPPEESKVKVTVGHG